MPFKSPVQIGTSDDSPTLRRKVQQLILALERAQSNTQAQISAVNVISGSGGGGGGGGGSTTGITVQNVALSIFTPGIDVLEIDDTFGLTVAISGSKATLNMFQDLTDVGTPEFAGLTLTAFDGALYAASGVVTAVAFGAGQLLSGNDAGTALQFASILTVNHASSNLSITGDVYLVADIFFTAGPEKIDSSGAAIFSSLTINTLTSGRVPIIGAGGIISEDAVFTWSGADQLQVGSLLATVAASGTLTGVVADNSATRAAGNEGILGAQLSSNTNNAFWWSHYQISAADDDSDFRLYDPTVTHLLTISRGGPFEIVGATNYMLLPEHSSAPGTPASGKGALYAKTDGLLYWKDDGGTEYDLTAGGGGGAPGGANTQMQYNASGSFGGDATFTYIVGTGVHQITTFLSIGSGASGTYPLYVYKSLSGNPMIYAQNIHSGGDGIHSRVNNSTFNRYTYTGEDNSTGLTFLMGSYGNMEVRGAGSGYFFKARSLATVFGFYSDNNSYFYVWDGGANEALFHTNGDFRIRGELSIGEPTLTNSPLAVLDLKTTGTSGTHMKRYNQNVSSVWGIEREIWYYANTATTSTTTLGTYTSDNGYMVMLVADIIGGYQASSGYASMRIVGTFKHYGGTLTAIGTPVVIWNVNDGTASTPTLTVSGTTVLVEITPGNANTIRWRVNLRALLTYIA